MNSHEITKEHIAYLHAFCKKKDINYVDLRIELVDHLCELIQAEWAKTPNLSFRDAFHKVYKGFGIFGFMDIATQHEKTMQKRYWREIWLFFKKWITPPLIVVTILVSGFVYYLSDAFPYTRLPLVFVIFGLIVSSAILTFVQFKRNKRIMNEKNMLMGGVHTNFFWVYYIFYIIMLQPAWLNNTTEHLNEPWLLTSAFMITLLFSRANYLLLQKAKEQLEDLKLKLA
jgi:hypothetical protein